jgi:hypothetical protein
LPACCQRQHATFLPSCLRMRNGTVSMCCKQCVLRGIPTPIWRLLPLLHDVGKVAAAQAGYPLTLWWRVPLVLLEAFFPQVLHRLSRADPAAGWRYVFYVHHAHPQIGAQWAQAAGCTPLACWLIEHHQAQGVTTPAAQKALLAALQWADGNN